MWVRSLAACDATCGGKAHGLARLIAARLPVPPGFVIEAAAFRALAGDPPVALEAIGHALEAAAQRIASAPLPAELSDAVDAALPGAGPTLAVRSSSTIEDRAGGAAAGVFASVVGVAAADAWPAIRAVWTSALTPLAAAYARATDRPELAIAVIVQQFVEGERVTVYTRAPGAPERDEVWLQRGELLTKHPRATELPAIVLALRAEAAIGAPHGADVELVIPSSIEIASTVERAIANLWIVQARPIVHPVAAPRLEPPPSVLAPLADGRVWTWDVAHNPDPLSPAQAGLVERVEHAELAPWSLRVCAGYLYSAPRGDLEPLPVPDGTTLAARAAEIEARFAQLLDDELLPVSAAIERYLAFYRIWATELVPLIRAARRGLEPEHVLGARPSAIEMTLLAAARGELDEAEAIRRLGILAPAWDVAVPTFGEQPAVIRAAIARATPPPARTIAKRSDDLERARAAADLAERDDLWFARAQWLVRRAILARAGELGLDPEDACWLPLAELATAAALDITTAHRRAGAARAAARRAASWTMPITVGGSVVAPAPALVGAGTGRKVTGRVVRFASLASAIAVTRGDIVVVRTVTPALAVIVIGCAALVSETGGLLDHGAALARELGITCVVGCHDAWSLLADGMIVTVDGDAGTVTR